MVNFLIYHESLHIFCYNINNKLEVFFSKERVKKESEAAQQQLSSEQGDRGDGGSTSTSTPSLPSTPVPSSTSAISDSGTPLAAGSSIATPPIKEIKIKIEAEDTSEDTHISVTVSVGYNFDIAMDKINLIILLYIILIYTPIYRLRFNSVGYYFYYALDAIILLVLLNVVYHFQVGW